MREFRLDTVGPIGDCAVLQVTGEVDVYTAPMLREQIQELSAKGAVHLIADLGRVDFLDSTGLGVLVGGLKRLREAGGSLALVISTPRILRIFQITGLTKALPAHRSVEDAITADPHWQHKAESQAGSVHDWCRQNRLSLQPPRTLRTINTPTASQRTADEPCQHDPICASQLKIAAQAPAVQLGESRPSGSKLAVTLRDEVARPRSACLPPQLSHEHVASDIQATSDLRKRHQR